MIRAPKLDPRVVEEARRRGRRLLSQAFHDLARSIGNGLRRGFRALSRAAGSAEERRSPFARGVRVGWL